MMDELDRRRYDWEKEIHRMQEDFFKVRIPKPQPTTCTNSSNNNEKQVALSGTDRYGNTTAVHLQSAQPQYIRADDADDDDGAGMLCQWQFDVTGYQPSDVNVKLDGGKLLVSARRADVKDADNTSSRELSKQMDIPRDVVAEEMTSYMTRDGFLVVQAPVARSRDSTCHVTPPRSGVKMEAVNGDNQQALDCHFRPIVLPPEQPPSDDVIAASRRHIIKTDDGDEMLKVVMDLGRSDYHPDDVSVQLSTNKLLVRVQRDDALPGVRNSIHREVSRDVDVPDTVYPPSVRAHLAPDGRLWIGAGLTTNEDHRRVSAYIVQMMPRHSQRCKRVSQLYAITN